MNTRDHDDEDFHEPTQKSEWEEWKEDDDARRYREYQSDNQTIRGRTNVYRNYNHSGK